MAPATAQGAPPALAPMQGMSEKDFQAPLVAALRLGQTTPAPAAPGSTGTTLK